MADYESAYTGAQMDAVFRRVNSIQLGTTQITAQMDGLAYADWDADPGLTGAVVLTGVAPASGGAGIISATASYSATTGQMFARIEGDGVQQGQTYTLHWLLIA